MPGRESSSAGKSASSRWSKYYSCDAASRAAGLALQVLGAYGYSGEYPVERYLRGAKLYQLIEGSVNTHKIIIANAVLEHV